ncbi:MAG: OmpA family protein [Acidobacteriia bacterium]|nr:OmpA family protein [Terriglobia bacterium]
MASASSGWPQQQDGPGRTEPLYRVTVIERTVKAVNYQYRSGPTEIDFRGTVLLPEAKGEATVESKAGRTEIDARFEHVLPATRYGREYLTYVLWAITPEGRARNLGEVLAGSSDKAGLRVTTDLQAFGLIVTAEPYAAVRQPGDVVVMENEIRPDTMGKIEPIQAKFELLPRGEYTYNVPADQEAAEGNGRRVSMSRYEELLEVYQAQNAVQIAGAMGAGQYAGDTYSRAQELLRNAQDLEARHAGKSMVITAAREAAQTAEDARAITVKRKQDSESAAARAEAAQERERRLRAEAEAQTARAQSSADRATLDQERRERQQVEAPPPAAAQTPQPPEPRAVAQIDPQGAARERQRDLRMRLYQQLGASALETSDTPRGLMVTIPAGDFRNGKLQPGALREVEQVAAVMMAQPGLAAEVDDNFDSGEAKRAGEVRAVLIEGGAPAGSVAARSAGGSRPIASNATPSGRERNRRVEIVIHGEAIGNMPYWDRSYPLRLR